MWKQKIFVWICMVSWQQQEICAFVLCGSRQKGNFGIGFNVCWWYINRVKGFRESKRNKQWTLPELSNKEPWPEGVTTVLGYKYNEVKTTVASGLHLWNIGQVQNDKLLSKYILYFPGVVMTWLSARWFGITTHCVTIWSIYLSSWQRKNNTENQTKAATTQLQWRGKRKHKVLTIKYHLR